MQFFYAHIILIRLETKRDRVRGGGARGPSGVIKILYRRKSCNIIINVGARIPERAAR